MKKIIFFQAHPDDLEFFCPHFLHYLSKQPDKYEIRIASLTKGEYGAPQGLYDRIKGKKLGIIREKELYRAHARHGISPEQIHFFGIFDGSVKFNESTLRKVQSYLKEEEPDIVFACEPRNTYYRHPDHMNTGKVVYLALKNLYHSAGPSLYFYGSINSTFRWPFNKSELQFAYDLMYEHQSQIHLWRYTTPLYRLMCRIHGMSVPGWKYAEGFRRVYYGKQSAKTQRLSYIQKIFLLLNVKVWPEKVTVVIEN